MPAKIARLATRPPFWIPEVSVAVRSSRPSCSKVEKTLNIHGRSAVIRGIPVLALGGPRNGSDCPAQSALRDGHPDRI